MTETETDSNLARLADLLNKLTWREMTSFTMAICEEIPHLQKSECLDPMGLASRIIAMAEGVARAEERDELPPIQKTDAP